MRALANIQLKLPYKIGAEGDLYVACCPILDVYSQGISEYEAIKSLNEALVLFIETCFEMGTLDDVLKGCGFHPDGLEADSEITNMLDVLVPLSSQNATPHAC